VTTFAILAGAVGANLSTRVIFILGAAFAYGIGALFAQMV
jgi:hypothetical protein